MKRSNGWTQTHVAEKPFFLNIWFHEPHAPLAAPDEIVSQYGDLTDPAAIYSGTIDNTDRAIARLGQETGNRSVRSMTRLSSTRRITVAIATKEMAIFACWVKVLFLKEASAPQALFTGRMVSKVAVSKIRQLEPSMSLPTICGLVGIDQPKNVQLDGTDLSPLLKTDVEPV